MVKKFKGIERSSRRQYIMDDNIKQIVARWSPSKERFSIGEYRELRPEIPDVTMTSTELLNSISGGIIKNGIKYMMFPLHFLRFYIFGKNSGKSLEESLKNMRSGSSTDTRNAGSSRGTDLKVYKDRDEGLVERPLVVVVEEDYDSSSDRCSIASSPMIKNVSMVSIDKSISLNSLVEPMDISIEEYTHERSPIVTRSRERYQSTLSLDSEMARIFRIQWSDNEYSSSNTLPKKAKRPRGKNFLCRAKTSYSAPISPLKSMEVEVYKEQKKKTCEEVNREWKKKVSSEDVTHHKRRKVSQEENRPEKQRDGKSDAKRREEKTTPVKSKESKREDVQCKEIGTQTDIAFSDDDVEMIPVDAKLHERRYLCRRAIFRSHPNLYLSKGEGHDSNYAADNEDSDDGFTRITRIRILSNSTSSCSTDLGFDEQGTFPELDIGTGWWHANARDTITSNSMCSRAPPGFPTIPQNPPLSYPHTDCYKVASTFLQNNPFDASSTQTGVPRAPAPMRHLYYDYPEFMDLPTTVRY